MPDTAAEPILGEAALASPFPSYDDLILGEQVTQEPTPLAIGATADVGDQTQELSSFLMYQRQGVDPAMARRIADFMAAEFVPTMTEMLRSLGYPEDGRIRQEDGLVNGASNEAVLNAMAAIGTLSKTFVQSVQADSPLPRTEVQPMLSNENFVNEFRTQFKEAAPPGTLNMLFELYVHTSRYTLMPRSQVHAIMHWMLLIGVTNQDFDAVLLRAWADSDTGTPILRHRYDLFTELGGSASGEMFEGINVSANSSLATVRVMHTLEIEASGGLDEDGQRRFETAQPAYQWQTWFDMVIAGTGSGASISLNMPADTPTAREHLGFPISLTITPPQPGVANDRAVNSATGYSYTYLPPSFFTSTLLVTQTAISGGAGMMATYQGETSEMVLTDGHQSLRIPQFRSGGAVLQITDPETVLGISAGFSVGLTTETVLGVPRSMLDVTGLGEVLDTYYHVTFPAENLLQREPRNRWSVRAVIGFATDVSTLGADDLIIVLRTARVLAKLEENAFLSVRPAKVQAVVWGSHSRLGKEGHNTALAARRASSVQSAFQAGLRRALGDTSSQGRWWGLDRLEVLTQVATPQGTRPQDNSAIDRTATVDVYIDEQA